jgi:protein disulfide-isomerase
MWVFVLLCTLASAPASASWITDFDAAKRSSRQSQRPIFAFFTGSDWCGWCKRLKAEVLDTAEFKAYASKNLVLLELDFPQAKPQPPKITQQNEGLAEKYSVEGFPTVLFLNASGQRIGDLGYQPGGPKPYIAAIQKLIGEKANSTEPSAGGGAESPSLIRLK